MERTAEKTAEKTAKAASEMTQTMGDTILQILDKLAGKHSDLKLSFEDLTFDMGMMKTRLNGAIVLDVVYAKED